jgi:hypothetical protein
MRIDYPLSDQSDHRGLTDSRPVSVAPLLSLKKDPAQLWQFYMLLVEVWSAFKTLKDDLGLRPIFHQLQDRIEAHIFVAFMAYRLHVTLRQRLKALAPGLTARSVLDKMAEVQMLDVHFPTTEERTLILSRSTELTKKQKVLLQQLNLALPPQSRPGSPPPVPSRAPAKTSCSGDHLGPGCDFAHFPEPASRQLRKLG